jgi:hypothetical protein
VDACGRVVDEPVGQGVEREPADRGALVGFPVGRRPNPAADLEEQAEAGFGAGTVDMQGVDQAQVFGVETDADFFLGLADRGVEDGLSRVELAGWQVPEAVEERIGVAATGEQNLVVADEEDVHVDQVSVGHRSSSVAHAVWGPAQLIRYLILRMDAVADCVIRVGHVADPATNRRC